LLNKVVQCNQKGEGCQLLAHKRLYAGNKYTISLPYFNNEVINEIHCLNKYKIIRTEAIPHNFNKDYLTINYQL